MSVLERGLLGLHAGAWLSLLGVSVLSLAEGSALNLLSDDVGGGRWWFLLGWLVFGVVVALPRSARHAFQLCGVLTALGLATLALPGVAPGHLAMPAGVLALALMCLWWTALLRRGHIQKARPQRPPRAARRAATPCPAIAWCWAGWLGVSTALVASFWVNWQGADADLRGRGAVLLLLVAFVALPAMTAAWWRPWLATLGLGLTTLLGLTQFTASNPALLAALLGSGVAALAAGWHGCRGPR